MPARRPPSNGASEGPRAIPALPARRAPPDRKAPPEPGTGGGASAAPIIGGESLAGGTADAYLKLETGSTLIPGESVARGFENQIVVKGFSFSGGNSGTTHQGPTGGAGRPQFDSFRISKLFDRSSIALLRGQSTGQRFTRATITFVRRGATQSTFLTYRFDDLLVDHYHQQGGKSEPPMLEDISFDFSKVTVTYSPQNPDGSNGAALSFGWDVAASQAL